MMGFRDIWKKIYLVTYEFNSCVAYEVSINYVIELGQ